mmetsp:Transcript_13470/g.40002  ORF Transcript_13470/g.40002 Transcript_13470/m.40002 type:complete len:340 (+) Transcript_13470:350-1369(+)
MPMHARGGIKVGSTAGVDRWSSRFGEAHMKPQGRSFTRLRSFRMIDDKEASTICRSARFKMRTSEWKAAKSKSTSAFHMSFFSRIGTSDITRVSSSVAFVLGSAALGYFTCSGKGLSGCDSNGSPLRNPNFINSKAVKQGSWKLEGMSLSRLPRTVMPASSEISPRFSRTMKCTPADSEFRSLDTLGNPGASEHTSLNNGPSLLNSCACQFKQNLKSMRLLFCRLHSACNASLLICHFRHRPIFGEMIRASEGRFAWLPDSPWRMGVGSQKALHNIFLFWKPECKWRAMSPSAASRYSVKLTSKSRNSCVSTNGCDLSVHSPFAKAWGNLCEITPFNIK